MGIAELSWPVRSTGHEILMLVLCVLGCILLLPGAIVTLAVVALSPSEGTAIFVFIGAMAVGSAFLFPLLPRAYRWSAERGARRLRWDGRRLSLQDQFTHAVDELLAIESGWTRVRVSSFAGDIYIRTTGIVPWACLRTSELPILLHAENDRGYAEWTARFAEGDLPASGIGVHLFQRDLTEVHNLLAARLGRTLSE